MIEYLPLILSVAVPTLTMIGLTLWIVPKITAKQIETVIEAFKPVIGRAMGTIADKSHESREVKKFEKEMMGDLLDKGLPELQILQELGLLSEERLDWIRDHPQEITVLIERYLPMAKKLLSMRKGGRFDKQTQTYDF